MVKLYRTDSLVHNYDGEVAYTVKEIANAPDAMCCHSPSQFYHFSIQSRDKDNETKSLIPKVVLNQNEPSVIDPPQRKSACRFVKRNVLVSAIANLSTAYNLSVINYAQIMIKKAHPPTTPQVTFAVASASLLGAILGQICFGYIGQTIGKREGMILTLILTVIGSITSASIPFTGDMLYYALAICRFILGVGVGGVYPLSASSAFEASRKDANHRQIVAGVFGFQGLGQLLAPLLTYIVLYAQISTNTGWRLILIVGSIPGLIVLYDAFRATKTSKAYTRLDESRRLQSSESSESGWAQNPDIIKRLAGAAMGWFLFDFTFYGNVLFTPIVLRDTYHFDQNQLKELAFYSLIVSMISLPGYITAVYVVGKTSFRSIQIFGFTIMSLVFFILSVYYKPLLHLKPLLLFLYASTFYFSNCGPNVSTFCIPAEIFSCSNRVKYTGIAAASGKIGASLGAIIFGSIEMNFGVDAVLIVCSAVSFFGALVTWKFIPMQNVA